MVMASAASMQIPISTETLRISSSLKDSTHGKKRRHRYYRERTEPVNVNCRHRRTQAHRLRAAAIFRRRFAALGKQVTIAGGYRRPLQRRLLEILENFCQCGNNFKKIVNDTVMGHLENRCLGVLVYGNDASRGLHSYQMLNRS